MELSTCRKVCSVYSTQEILPVSNFGQGSRKVQTECR